MPFLLRKADGSPLSLYREPQPGADWVAADHPDVLSFMDGDLSSGFARLDASLIRVVEDLVDVLISRELIRITDLPLEAQEKLFSRKSFREKSSPRSLSLYNTDHNGELISDRLAGL